MALTLAMLLLLLTVTAESRQPTASCSAVTDVFITQITCRFAPEVARSMTGFKVQFRYPNSDKDLEETLECKKGRSGGWEGCQKMDDVTFDQGQKVNFTLTLIQWRRAEKGVYVCQPLPFTEGSAQACAVRTREEVLEQLAADYKLYSEEQENSSPLNSPMVVVILVFVVLFLFIVILLVVILFFKRESFRNRFIGLESHPNGSDEEKGLNQDIPPGWATYYYKLGYAEQEKAMEKERLARSAEQAAIRKDQEDQEQSSSVDECYEAGGLNDPEHGAGTSSSPPGSPDSKEDPNTAADNEGTDRHKEKEKERKKREKAEKEKAKQEQEARKMKEREAKAEKRREEKERKKSEGKRS